MAGGVVVTIPTTITTTQITADGERIPYPDYTRLTMALEYFGSEGCAGLTCAPSVAASTIELLKTDKRLWDALVLPWTDKWYYAAWRVAEGCAVLGLDLDETWSIWVGSVNCTPDITYRYHWEVIEQKWRQWSKCRVRIVTPMAERPPFWEWLTKRAEEAQERDPLTETLEQTQERHLLDDLLADDCCVSDNGDALLAHMRSVHGGGLQDAAVQLVRAWECS
jgi:hypothetical protein